MPCVGESGGVDPSLYPAFADLSHGSLGWVGQTVRATAGAAR